MSLTADLVSQFVEATKDETQESSDGVVYGTVVKDGDALYVQLDGSTTNTPASTTMNVKHGDRVTVLIKNHTATITGNFSYPADSMTSTMSSINSFDIAVGNKVSVDTLTANSAFIKFLLSDEIIAETITAAAAKISELDVDKLTVDDLKAIYGNFDSLDAYFADIGVAAIDKATIQELNAVSGHFRELSVDFGEFEKVVATKAQFGDIVAKTIDAEIIHGTSLDGKFANIDFANITEAAFESFFAKAGMIDKVVIGSATVPGELVVVTFKGDIIEAGTIKAEQLILRNDKDGLYYKLNVDSLGKAAIEALPPESQTNLQNGLHGSVIVAHSITADQLSVSDLSAFKALIAGFSITNNEYEVTENGDVVRDDDGTPKNKITGAIYSGVKSSVDNTTRGIYLDNDGQVAFGDTNYFVKFHKNNTTDKYELAINAAKIVLGTKNVGEAIDEDRQLIESLKEKLSVLVTGDNNATLFDQTPDGFTFNFTQIRDIVDKLNDNMLESLEYNGHIVFNENSGKPHIVISPADNGIKLKLSTDKIQFVKNDMPITTISADDEGRMGMEVDNETVTGELRQTHSNVRGEFIWQVRSNGNYGLWWKKEENS